MKKYTPCLSSLSPVCSVLLAIALFSMTGCAAKYRISIPDSDESDIQHKTVSMNAYLWGSYMDPLVEFVNCEGEGINDVIVVDHLGYDLTSVLTLGIWKPISVSYRCMAPGESGSVVVFPDESTKNKNND